jgi:hypothetical protein
LSNRDGYNFMIRMNRWMLRNGPVKVPSHRVPRGYNATGQENGFLLSPVPEPATIVIWSLLGGLGIAVGWRRKRAG